MPGIERLEAHFAGRAYAPHRHDTYAIGLTLSGVQSFRYRGAMRHCRPGQCLVIHPDELHDGMAGTEAGFGYRIAYVDPALVHHALDGAALPFVADPVLDLPQDFTAHALWDMHGGGDDLHGAELAVAVADFLRASASRLLPPPRLDRAGLARARDLLAVEPARRLPIAHLERVSGLDRWSLARQFRAAYGTSPSRFRTMRQLDVVRRLLVGGVTLAQAALDAGFADQSHMTRHFRRAWGLTPARWLAGQRAVLR